MPGDPAEEESLPQLRAWLHRCAAVLLDGRLRGKLDASDVVQDTLLKACANREQFRGGTDAERRAWLRRILNNTLTDLVRRHLPAQKRGGGRERSLEELVRDSSASLAGLLADGRAGPAEAAGHSEDLLWLAEGLAELPEEQREAVRLRHLAGMSVREVARATGKTSAAVAGLLRRGLEALRQRPGGAGP